MYLWYLPHKYKTSRKEVGKYALANHALALLLGFLVPLALIATGLLQKFPAESAMPLVVSCSAAISANCHRPDKDEDAWRLPVRWGVINPKEKIGAKLCSFTTLRNVQAPEEGDIVRGRRDPKRDHSIAYSLRRCWLTFGRLWQTNIRGVHLLDLKKEGRKTAWRVYRKMINLEGVAV
jgi:hypothetical protein